MPSRLRLSGRHLPFGPRVGARDLDRSAWTAGGLLHAQGDRRSGHALDRPRCAHPAVRPRSSSPSQQFLRSAGLALRPSRRKTRGRDAKKPSKKAQRLPRCGTHLCVALYLACYSTHVPPHEHTHTSHMDSHRMVGHTHTLMTHVTHGHGHALTRCPPRRTPSSKALIPNPCGALERLNISGLHSGLLQAHDGARARRARRYALTLVGY